MSERIPPSHVDIFARTPFAALATLMPDGRPHVTSVWCDYDGEHILINVVRDDIGGRNVLRDPRVGLTVADPSNPYRYVGIDGRVVEFTEEGAEEQIDVLSRKYLGQDRYPFRAPGETRLLLRIAPEQVRTNG